MKVKLDNLLGQKCCEKLRKFSWLAIFSTGLTKLNECWNKQPNHFQAFTVVKNWIYRKFSFCANISAMTSLKADSEDYTDTTYGPPDSWQLTKDCLKPTKVFAPWNGWYWLNTWSFELFRQSFPPKLYRQVSIFFSNQYGIKKDWFCTNSTNLGTLRKHMVPMLVLFDNLLENLSVFSVYFFEWLVSRKFSDSKAWDIVICNFALQIFKKLERSNQYARRYCVPKSRNAKGISQLGVNKLSVEVNCKLAKCVWENEKEKRQ